MSAMLNRVDRANLTKLRDRIVWHNREVAILEDAIATVLDVRRGNGEQKYFDIITDATSNGSISLNEMIRQVRVQQARDADERAKALTL
jgi:hypothetical protein